MTDFINQLYQKSRAFVSFGSDGFQADKHALTHARTHVHTHMHISPYTCTHALTHARTCTFLRTHAHTHTRTHLHTCTFLRTHAHTHTRPHMHTCTSPYIFFSSAKCTNGQIMLVGGSTSNEGTLQVCVNNTWGTVCDNNWSVQDATVACKQLGFSKYGTCI